MQRFRLIKEYPGSPELGYEIEFDDELTSRSLPSGIFVNTAMCNNNNFTEYWRLMQRDLKYYEQILFNYSSYSHENYTATHYKWLKDTNPKLYWTKILQLIADDLNGGWEPDWEREFKYYIAYSYKSCKYCAFAATNYKAMGIYFKDRILTDRIIELMGDKLDYIFK